MVVFGGGRGVDAVLVTCVCPYAIAATNSDDTTPGSQTRRLRHPESSTINSCWQSRAPSWDSTSGWTESGKCQENTAKKGPQTIRSHQETTSVHLLVRNV